MKEAAAKANPANLAKKDEMMDAMMDAPAAAEGGMWAHKLDTISVWFFKKLKYAFFLAKERSHLY